MPDGTALKLDGPGPSGGTLVLVADFEKKMVSLVEVKPGNQQGTKLMVWEVQDYTKTGS